MFKHKGILAILLACMIVFISSSALATYIHNDCHDPDPNVWVTATSPYYFEMVLPSWDLGKDAYTEATFDLTYLDQSYLGIFVYAADPLSNPKNYDILLGTVSTSTPGASGTAQFDLLALNESEFMALFMGQSTLYVKTNCHYVFDKACLHMEAVPIPGAVWLLGSCLIGLIGLRRRMKK